MGAQEDKIILNHAHQAYHFIKQAPGKVAYFFDNVGKELFFDLAFVDYLLESGLAKSVTCYLKNQPFFVSDAMPKDLLASISHLQTLPSNQCYKLGKRLQKAINSGQIALEAPPFFATSRMYRQMPEVLATKIRTFHLTILKGDVNYRRLFGDRHWKPTTPVKQAGGYFPSSFLSLRTLKGEIVVGLSNEVLQNLEEKAEPDWLINGLRGMITFHQKNSLEIK
jgi:hypothetical protein